MGNDYFAVIIGFIGVLIGSLGSSLMIYIQSKIQDNRERTKLVVNAALEEYKEILWIVEEVISLVNNLQLDAIKKDLSFAKIARKKLLASS